MSNLEVKHVSFMGADLMAAKDENGTIWAGVRWMCDGIGLTRNQRDNQIEKIKSDSVLSKGAGNLTLPTAGGNQAVWCLELDFIPLWLAKINITPSMKADTPEVAARLEAYQLKAKDVLAEAFLPQQQMQLSDSELMAKALIVAQKTIEARDLRICELSSENSALISKREADRPLVEFATNVIKSDGSVSVSNFAKMLCSKGMKIGNRRLLWWLRDNKYLMKSFMPYQVRVNRGVFEVVDIQYQYSVYPMSYITPKGQKYLYEKLSENYGK